MELRETATPARSGSGGDLRVLLVDDDVASRRSIAMLLEHLGAAVTEAAGGDEGLTLFAAQPADVVITDYQMPDRNGLEVLAEVHRMSHLTPVILVTAYPGLDLVVAALRQGALDFLAKPMRLMDLRQCLDRARVYVECNREMARHEADRHLVEERRAILETAVEQSADAVLITDRNHRIVYVNPAFLQRTGYTAAELLGRFPGSELHVPPSDTWLREAVSTIESGEVFKGHFRTRRKDGTILQEEGTIAPIRDSSGEIVNYVNVKRDLTEIDALRGQLLQAQKLEAIGQLAAGIAHEINTPTQFIGDNLTYLGEMFGELAKLVRAAQQLVRQERDGEVDPAARAAAAAKLTARDTEFILEDIPAAIRQSLGGVERVAKIVRATKEFSHPGGLEKENVDLNRALENTATVARNEWKHVADITYDLDPNLGLVPCLPGEINQVLLNLIVNAAHAIREKVGTGSEKGTITLQTRLVGGYVEIVVADTGAGIPPEVRDRVFEPFFTTKAVGHGTGQGLAIARSVVVDKHRGTLTFDTEVGRGTVFQVRLPRDGEANRATGAAGLIEM